MKKLSDEDKKAIAILIASGAELLLCFCAGFIIEFIVKAVRG